MNIIMLLNSQMPFTLTIKYNIHTLFHNLHKHIHILDDSRGIMSTCTISTGLKWGNTAYGENCWEPFMIATFMSYSRVYSQFSR